MRIFYFERNAWKQGGWQLAIWRLFQLSWEPGLGWCRIVWLSFSWKDTRRHRLYFSERHGLTRRLKLGDWRFGLELWRWRLL